MPISVTNSLTGEREVFEPQEPGTVSLYFCGLTTSDPPHLGHARAWVHVDVMRRWLEHRGYRVRHVENFTDVNEKIVARIGAEGDDEAAVARHYIESILRDRRALNLKRADVYPRVSEHIPEIIDLIGTLIEAEHAYEANGSVYFDVTSFEAYGDLSNQAVEELDAHGEDRAEKHHPADFALWKAGAVAPADANQHRDETLEPLTEAHGQTWDSPWGEGRPGWHIECSAMSMTHLDETFDIHVAGQDLVFPHNENEIAQSEAATDQPFARHWLHVRMLETDGEKMSSSLRNFFTVEHAIEEFGPNPVRVFLLSTQYTQRQSYTEAGLHEAVERWERLKRAYERAVDAIDGPDAYAKAADDTLRSAVDAARDEFADGMDEDFNTRVALRALDEVASAVNAHIEAATDLDYRGLRRAVETFEGLGGEVLGLTFDDAAEEGPTDALIGLVLELREEERAAGNYDRADELRERLEALGITVEDTDDGPTYRR